jgi:hypothetical protein
MRVIACEAAVRLTKPVGEGAVVAAPEDVSRLSPLKSPTPTTFQFVGIWTQAFTSLLPLLYHGAAIGDSGFRQDLCNQKTK